MAVKTADDFLKMKSRGKGTNFSDAFKELPADEKDKVLEELKKIQTPPASNEREAGDDGF